MAEKYANDNKNTAIKATEHACYWLFTIARGYYRRADY